jgi:PTS system glucitol/sorbitol-specific IIC component
MVEQTGTAVGHVIALLFAASREAVDVSLRNVIPFMAFVSLLIALVQETALGSLIAHALTPLANSLWGWCCCRSSAAFRSFPRCSGRARPSRRSSA